MSIDFVLLAVGAYLAGSIPSAYIAAKLSRNRDLREYGTGNVGLGNLWEMASRRLVVPVAVFDVGKGMAMVWAAQLLEMGVIQQVTVGLLAVIGHNWPVFLRFSGGRGILTTIGVVSVLMPWGVVSFLAICMVVPITKSSAVPVLAGIVSLPIVSWATGRPLEVTLGMVAMVVIVVARRLTAPKTAGDIQVSKQQMLLNRLLFDRDIRNREEWIYRVPADDNLTQDEREQLRKRKRKKGMF